MVRGEREDAIAAAVPCHDVERARADRPGGAENGEVHPFALIQGSSSAARGSVAVALSMRSRMPPWPGSSAPLSLTPAWRLAADSKRSPTMLIAASRAATAR